ncbi:CoA transferase [Bradyrhizobium murdochi]|uniref:CoA transferase n=1 Tax=Bradyrhizobium murdochi TaxID=1038859 RepID=UPI001F21F751|nr:CoA transferase [Bradyrhizobium murdochi]
MEPDEPQFYTELVKRLGLDHDEQFINGHKDRESWSALSAQLNAIFSTKTRAQWCELLEGTDACFAPVLSPPEAALDPHNVARGVYVTVDGVLQAAPAPRFSATPTTRTAHVAPRGAHTHDILSELKLTTQQVEHLTKSGVLGEDQGRDDEQAS